MDLRKPSPDVCPCGTPNPYAACCGHYLDLGQLPATAEALMRSRYVAYVRKRSDYLLRTWHPITRPPQLDFETESVSWLGLKVVRSEAGGPRTLGAPWNLSPATKSPAGPTGCTKSAVSCGRAASGFIWTPRPNHSGLLFGLADVLKKVKDIQLGGEVRKLSVAC